MTVQINWDELGFGFTPTKEMFVAHAELGGSWDQGGFQPFGEIKMHPAAGVINYAQCIFEGLKAQRDQQNKVWLFRPEENAKRFYAGAERLYMPPFPVKRFVEAVHELVKRNIEYVPPYGKGGLYIRPWMAGTGPILGVAPAPSYTTLMFASPVGAYFKKKGQAPIKLEVCTDFHRAAAKGTGGTKYSGNYGGEIYFAQRAKAQGYNGCLYLEAHNERMVEEVGGANFFCVSKGKLLTPRLTSILPGITRESIIQLARDFLKMEVEERDVTIEEALIAEECFCTGTAAVIAPIGMLAYKGKEYIFNQDEVGPVTKKMYELLTKIQLNEMPDSYGWRVEV